jgi:tetratricopeptide (TPR) repeat protein
MNRQEAQQIAEGYTAQCESGARDWGWIDSADSPCRSFLFFHPDYYTGSLVGLSCLGMVDVVNEGDPLESYVNFMINAIESPSEAEAMLEGLKESFLTEGSPVSLLKAFSVLMEDRYACHILDDGGEYMRLLLAAALESGDKDVAEMISDRGWEVFCKLESGNWGLDPINKEVEGLMEAGDHAGAESLCRGAMEACEIVLGPEGVSRLDCAKNLGNLLIDIGNMDGAEEVIRKELAGRESLQGPDHEDTLSCLTNLSYVMGSKGDMTAAEELCRRALAGYEKSLGSEHPDTLVNVGSLAVILSSKGDHEAAGDLLRRALTGFGNTLGVDAPHTLQCVSSLGSNMNQRGDREGAISLLKEYSEHSEAARDALAYNLACYECLDGNHDEAKALIADHIKKHPGNKQQALSDKDLESIHDFIGGL